VRLRGQEVVVLHDILEQSLGRVLLGVFGLAVLEVDCVNGLADADELLHVPALGNYQLGFLVELGFPLVEFVVVDLAVVADEVLVIDLEVFFLVAGEVVLELADGTLDRVLCRVDVLEAAGVVFRACDGLLTVFLADFAEFEIRHFDAALVAPLEVLTELGLDVPSLGIEIGAENLISPAS
jgi:hypothetical protein